MAGGEKLIGGRHDQNLAGRLKACSIVLDIIILPCPRKSLSMLVIFESVCNLRYDSSREKIFLVALNLNVRDFLSCYK